MLTSAKLSKISFVALLINASLVMAVVALRPVFATGQSQEAMPVAPDVQVPADDSPEPQTTVNAAPAADNGSQEPALPSIPAKSLQAPPEPANKMVVDEILKVIQDSRGELDVPPLSFPTLPTKPADATRSSNPVDQLTQRLKSIAAITQSAQVLLKEAQLLQASGHMSEAHALIEHVQTLKSILVELAAGEAVAGQINYSVQ